MLKILQIIIKEYRTELNGLKSLAVILVLIYHLGFRINRKKLLFYLFNSPAPNRTL